MRLFKQLYILIIFILCRAVGLSQTCSTLGQTPSTAFPVCGIDTFSQTIVPNCGGKEVPGPCTNVGGVTLTDLNPFWYKFTCFTSGTLGFLIQPDDQNDDYDWQLFDVTGRNPDDVYTDVSLYVACNWSGRVGNTGASASGTGLDNCAGQTYPLFSSRPSIIAGHNYLLLLSHFNTFTQGNNDGYKLSFGGGTAVITDTVSPALKSASTSCDGTQIRVKLSKKMRCNSLAEDGSDFAIAGSGVTIKSIIGIGCTNGFDMDSVILNLSEALAPGDYSLIAKSGTDENTILDNCNNPIPENSTIPFTVFGRQPTPFDSLATVTCAPASLQLIFRKNIDCNSIADDGSDFQITGPHPVTIASANGNCSNDVSSVINLNLTSPIVHEGTYTITLLKGNDGNSIIDECGIETPVPATITFSVKDTVSANFTYNLVEGCREDSLKLFHNGANGVTEWNWNFDDLEFSSDQNPQIVYTTFGNKSIKLNVTNGFCSDSTELKLYLNHDSLRAAFTGPAFFCPNDVAYFRDTSVGTIVAWDWLFGNGYTSTLQYPPAQVYLLADKERTFPVRLIVVSNKNCTDTSLKYIKVVNNCYIAVPTAFTPNMDGRNDYLYPLNAYKASNLEFKVFNKYGQQLFETKDWTHKWDGSFHGSAQPSGVYVWFLQYTATDTGQKVFLKGTTVLIR